MERREGDVRPKRQSGDRHSQRIEAHAELILSAVAAKSDITLAELQECLKEHGAAVAIGALWRLFNLDLGLAANPQIANPPIALGVPVKLRKIVNHRASSAPVQFQHG